jgi:parvulin-like peptidyl-prolyl isomerase
MQKFKTYKWFILGGLILTVLVYLYWQYEHNKEVIAKVGQFEISKSEFKKEMRYRGGDNLSMLNKKALLEEMILKKLLLNKAQADDLPNEASIQREYNLLLMGKIRERYLETERKKIVISKSDLENYYKENKEKYRIPTKCEFAILFFKKRSKDVKKEKELIAEKFAEVKALLKDDKLPKAKKGFGSYAIDYSEHQASRYRGGELGWFSQGKEVNWEQKVLDVGFKLKALGDLSSMVETKKGYYLVRLMDETKERYKTFKKVQGAVKHQLLMQKQKEIKENFYTHLRKAFNIEKDLSKLDDFNNSVNLKEEKRPPMGLI